MDEINLLLNILIGVVSSLFSIHNGLEESIVVYQYI